MTNPVETPPRQAALDAMFAEAQSLGKRVYGYRSSDGHGGTLHPAGLCEVCGLSKAEQRKLFGDIDRICIEGSGKKWLHIPKEKT